MLLFCFFMDYLLCVHADGRYVLGRDVTALVDGDTVWLMSPHMPTWLGLGRDTPQGRAAEALAVTSVPCN